MPRRFFDMNRMTNLAFAGLATVMVTSGWAYSQEPDASAEPVASIERAAEIQQRIQDMFVRLDVTEDQQAELEPIIRDNMDQRRALMEAAGLGDGGRPNRRKMMGLRDDMQALRADTESKVAEILTEEQMAEFRVIQQENQAQMREQMQARRNR